MTTTAERWIEATPSSAGTTASPDLMAVFRIKAMTTHWESWLLWGSTEDKSHAQWMHELVQLAREPKSLARDSEGNIWGFGADA